MLKTIPKINLNNSQTKAKCGEIFCHSPTEFSIYCVFCELKCFDFCDFLLHMQNVHFEDDTMERKNIGCAQFVEVDIKNENRMKKNDEISIEGMIWEDVTSHGHSPFSDNVCDEKQKVEYKKVKGRPKEGKKNKFHNQKLTVVKDDSSSLAKLDANIKTNNGKSAHFKTNNMKKSAYTCEYCGKLLKNAGLMKIHISRVHGMKKTNDVAEEENYQNKGNVEKKKDQNIEIACSECQKIFPNRRVHDHHCITEHNGFKCSQCEKRFQAFYKRTRHEFTHGEKKFTCSVEGCNKSFADKLYLRRHFDVHIRELNFICDFENCGKAFKSKRRLSSHKQVHTKPKNLICDSCGYTCRMYETLRVHLRIHTGEKPYSCRVCKKGFISNSALNEHMASHTNARPHVCKVCNATFARQKALYHHRFLHLDHKKFKCKICGNAYKQAAGLAGHMRKHREEGMLSLIPESRTPPSVFPNYFV